MTPDAELSGYAEVRAMYQMDVEGTPWQLVERVRPSFEIQTGPRVRAVGVVEGFLAQGRDTSDELYDFLQGTEVGDRLDEFCTPAENYSFDDIHDYLTVERLYVDFTGEKVDIRVGRQAVNWGSALVFHPTDLYNEVIASEPWRERTGVNAVRANIALGDHGITALATMDDDLSAFEKAAANDDGADEDIGEGFPLYEDLPVSVALKGTLRAAQTDFSVVANYRPDGDYFLGGDLRGTLGAGWWVEGGWHGEAAAPEVVAGLDYSFPWGDRFYVAAEYRYDGTGEADPDDYDYSLRSSTIEMPYTCEFATFGSDDNSDEESRPRVTLGQHYVDGTVNVMFLDNYGISTTAIANVVDGTGLLVPDVSVLVGDRVAVHVGAQIPFGKEGEFVPPDELFEVAVGDASLDLSGFVPAATLNAWARYSF
ncbi:MAG: hypothetical protein FJ102_11105 [Deltaproteobacteria bacterium]|nr:hypothetical protein [Deltaproteobacteria bacterium]